MSELKAGTRLRSTVDTTEVVVIRPPAAEGEVGCGGAPMVPVGTPGDPTGAPAAGFDGGTQLGKRYGEEGGIELLCTKPGPGSLSFDGVVLPVKGAKPLPSSD